MMQHQQKQRFVRIMMLMMTLTATTISAFTTTAVGPANQPVHLKMSCDSHDSTENTAPTAAGSKERMISRRNVLTSTATSLLLSSSMIVPATLISQPSIASAAVSGTNKVNAKLKTFGIAPVSDSVPDGFVPLLEIYGKGKNRSPLLVTFVHPISWVVTLPSNTINGEDGTIQVGDYGKGDTASLFIDDSITGSGNEITKDMISAGLQKCISQRGSNMYQNFKLLSVEDGPTSSTEDGQVYKIAKFKYQLLTGAGFEVDRKGIASVTMSSSGNKQLEIFWAASIDARYKKTADTLQTIVSSFRCYSSGLNFAEEVLS